MSMEANITELQIKLSFQEELLETLNQQITDQELRLAKLNLQMQALIERVKNLDANPQQAGSADNAAHEIPPHY
jgi:SlyX protein